MDRTIALALALVWTGASLIGTVVAVRRGLWAAWIVGPLGVVWGVLWIQAARKGRRLQWREDVWPWRRP